MQVTALLTQLRTWFLQGIALLAPLVITIALLFWLGRSIENVVGILLRHLLPQGWYLPGMGLTFGLVVTLAAGLLANLFLVRRLVDLAEWVLDRIPLVKSLFQGLKDVARFFARTGDQDLGRPVVVTLPSGDGTMQLVGFVMQEHAQLPLVEPGPEQETRIAVYMPMSYQVGGYTVYLERSRVQPLAVGAEQALRSVITGGSLIEGSGTGRSDGAVTAMGRHGRRKSSEVS
ncbi:MAG: DUF502 domain-containing protein [Wenzhouxiangella sp.]|jgi:uncharacterized membrane protein|nr:DUF502 domain-containing protein [Wenzhouxiangella sp.]